MNANSTNMSICIVYKSYMNRKLRVLNCHESRIAYSPHPSKTFDSAFDDYLKDSSVTKGVCYFQHIYMKSKKS